VNADLLAHLSSLFTLAGFVDVFQVVIGVFLSLGGLGLLLMGLLAVADRAVRRGGIAALSGLLLLAGGLYLVGVLG
jgi:hypothetical protein